MSLNNDTCCTLLNNLQVFFLSAANRFQPSITLIVYSFHYRMEYKLKSIKCQVEPFEISYIKNAFRLFSPLW